MKDYTGYVCVGLTVLFLAAVLHGHSKREHLAQEASVWDTVRVDVEKSLGNIVDYDLSAFRKAVLPQSTFFATMKDTLDKLSAEIAVPLGAPTVAEMKNTERMFDERVRLLTEEMHSQHKKSEPTNLIAANSAGMGVCMLKQLAKNYMILTAIDIGTSPKKSAGVSTSISSSLSNIFG
jgi:hypothetical protein